MPLSYTHQFFYYLLLHCYKLYTKFFKNTLKNLHYNLKSNHKLILFTIFKFVLFIHSLLLIVLVLISFLLKLSFHSSVLCFLFLLLMIDYLFDATGLVEGTYLIYDPTVAAAPAAQDSSLGKNGAHARTQGLAAGMIMIILAGLASWM